MYKILIKIKKIDSKISKKILEREFINSLNLGAVFLDLKEIFLFERTLILKVLTKESLNKIINEITKLKLNNRKLKILDIELDITEVKIEKLKRLVENKIVIIEFLTPTTFKIGSNFKGNYSNYIFFSWLLRKVNKELPKEEKIILLRDKIEKIEIINMELKNIEIKINEYIVPAFQGKIELNFKEIDDDLIKIFEELLNYGLKNNIGYKTKNGYGKIRITN